MESVEINRVGKRRRACTAGERVREKQQKLQKAVELWYGVYLKP